MFGLDVTTTMLGLAFLAGLVTTLSPCVLPLLPIVAASATGRSRWGLVALALGLIIAFTTVGVAVSSTGQLLGLHERTLRTVAGLLMLVFGALLLSPHAQAWFTRLSTRLGNAGHQGAARIQSDHPAAQLAVGVLMGVAWSPCVGPTLGAAIALAAQGGGVAEATVVMTVFSFAAVIPLALAGLASRQLFLRHRSRMADIGRIGRWVMGLALIVIGALVLTGLDKQMEAALLNMAPDWLLELTTRF